MTDQYISIDGREKKIHNSISSILEGDLSLELVVQAYIRDIQHASNRFIIHLREDARNITIAMDSKTDRERLDTMFRCRHIGLFLIYISLGQVRLKAILEQTKREIITPDFVQNGQVWRYNVLNAFLISASSLPPVYKTSSSDMSKIIMSIILTKIISTKLIRPR